MNEDKSYARVVLTGVDIPFGQLVSLMIKLALASIPAVIIFSVLGLLISVLITFILAFFGLGLW